MTPFSAQWFRVAGLRPRLAGQLSVQRQQVRGELWHVLSLRGSAGGGAAGAAGESGAAQSSDTACRLNAAAYAVAARFDGQRSVQQVWDALQLQHDDGPSQDEVLNTLLTLHAHHLVEFDHAPDFGALRVALAQGALRYVGRGCEPGDAASAQADAAASASANANASASGRSAARATLNPLFMRLPLFNPSRLLDRLMPLAPYVFSRAAAVMWTLEVGAMLVAALLHAGQLRAHAAQWLTTPRYLMLAALLVPPIKALHELGHALALRHLGGAVRQAGISLMLLMPMPYVDASAAAGLAQARQRALVSAAGIMVELAVASAGLGLWLHTDSGWLHDAGFVAWFVGGVSTLLFNANPLQRFDGYYLLTDLLHLPNLGPRSRAFWLDRLRAWVEDGDDGRQGEDAGGAMPTARGERPWLWVYAPAAWLYQLLLLATLTLWLGSVSQWLGWALCAWLLVQTLGPALRLLRALWRTALEAAQAPNAATRAGASPTRTSALGGALVLRLLPASAWRVLLLAAAPVLALLLPLPDSSLVRGVVWARDDALLRAGTEGFVIQVQVQDGATVRPGDLLLELGNPSLQAERERVASQLEVAEHEQFQTFGEDGRRSGNAAEDAQRLRGELERLDQRLAGLQVRARVAGRVVLPHAADLPGSYVRRGALLGHVLTGEPALLRVAVGHEEALRLRERLRGIQARVADRSGQALPGQLLRDSLGATRELPSAALSERHGGAVLTDPKDDQDRRAVEPVVVMDVLLPQAATTPGTAPETVPEATPGAAPGGTRNALADAQRLGTRAWVRFDLGWAPLAAQLMRWGRERVQSRFNPAR